MDSHTSLLPILFQLPGTARMNLENWKHEEYQRRKAQQQQKLGTAHDEYARLKQATARAAWRTHDLYGVSGCDRMVDNLCLLAHFYVWRIFFMFGESFLCLVNLYVWWHNFMFGESLLCLAIF
jgi:hypothetical protein